MTIIKTTTDKNDSIIEKKVISDKELKELLNTKDAVIYKSFIDSKYVVYKIVTGDLIINIEYI